MAKENKYNLDVPTIPDNEPIILFRAKDAAVPAMLSCYVTLCRELGSPKEFVDHIEAVRDNMLIFQSRNIDLVRAPD